MAPTSRQRMTWIGATFVLAIGVFIAAPTTRDTRASYVTHDTQVQYPTPIFKRDDSAEINDNSTALDTPIRYIDLAFEKRVRSLRRAIDLRRDIRWSGRDIVALGDTIRYRWNLDQRRVELDLYRNAPPRREVSGYVFTSRHVASVAPWSLVLTVISGRNKTLGHGFAATFSRQGANEGRVRLQVGTSYEVSVGDLHCQISAIRRQTTDYDALHIVRDELNALLRSPSSFQETVYAHLTELQEEAEAAIRGERSRTDADHHDLKPNHGCSTISLRPDQASAFLERLELIFAERHRMLHEEAPIFYQLLADAVPSVLLIDEDKH